ncbi:MAG: hypothetical protein Q9225_007284 [Loekoesia sp. 1 TL-2023]
MPSTMCHFILFLAFHLFSLVTASPINATLVPHKDYEPGDTLGHTMCFCTNNNNFTQWDGNRGGAADPKAPPSNPYAFQSVPENHEVAFVYKFDYYNHRLDHHFALHALDKCSTRPDRLPNACLNWPSQHRDWCHTFFTADVPRGIKYHSWEFCYQFRGDTFHNAKHRDFWTFYKDKRGLPRKRDWIGDEGLVRSRCEEVCGARWGMEMFEDRLGGVFSRVDFFHALKARK